MHSEPLAIREQATTETSAMKLNTPFNLQPVTSSNLPSPSAVEDTLRVRRTPNNEGGELTYSSELTADTHIVVPAEKHFSVGGVAIQQYTTTLPSLDGNEPDDGGRRGSIPLPIKYRRLLYRWSRFQDEDYSTVKLISSNKRARVGGAHASLPDTQTSLLDTPRHLCSCPTDPQLQRVHQHHHASPQARAFRSTRFHRDCEGSD
ncbi:hypothetical protein C8Q80DRAFT_264641 [Daedaleopsis nitida]|nr:hypothetical protein C8Q80DRAFT_264641 [Daedaleopsis nitida]